MYAALATAWNLLGGYSGYLSLGHAAFFGLGAYAARRSRSSTTRIGSGYDPFFVLPARRARRRARRSLPIAWLALRTRH